MQQTAPFSFDLESAEPLLQKRLDDFQSANCFPSRNDAAQWLLLWALDQQPAVQLAPTPQSAALSNVDGNFGIMVDLLDEALDQLRDLDAEQARVRLVHLLADLDRLAAPGPCMAVDSHLELTELLAAVRCAVSALPDYIRSLEILLKAREKCHHQGFWFPEEALAERAADPAKPAAHGRSVHHLAGNYLAIRIGSQDFAVPVARVREVMRFQQLTVLPLMPKYVKGFITLQGDVIPVVDPRPTFGMPERDYNRRSWIVVAHIESVTTGTRPIGIIVDGVAEQLLALKSKVIISVGAGTGVPESRPLLGLAKIKSRTKLLLDVDRLLPNETEPRA
jgi:purine-binding chemotaxis protein CheW